MLLFEQLLGVLFVYVALFGEKRLRSTFQRETEIATRLLFGFVGLYLVWSSTHGLYRLVGYSLSLAVLSLAALGISVLEFVSRRRYKGWRHWPRIEATVESSGVREIRSRHSHYFVAELAYSYVVEEDYYSGRFGRDFQDEAAAWEYADQMRGSKAIVHYHPKHPDRTKADAFL